MLKQAKKVCAQIAEAELALRRNRDWIFDRAWELGKILVELKKSIGPGRWQIWLHANFHELGHSEESRKKNAQRCIRFWKDNTHLIRARNSSFSESDFSTNSMRTFMWGYVPVKERLRLAGDESVKTKPHYFTFANHYTKFRRQMRNGHIKNLPSIATIQRDLEPTCRDLIEWLGRDFFECLLDRRK